MMGCATAEAINLDVDSSVDARRRDEEGVWVAGVTRTRCIG